MNGLKWVPTSGKLNVAALGKTPVDGGVDTDGTPLYVARAQHKGAFHPGKCSEKLKGRFRFLLIRWIKGVLIFSFYHL
jgi:hypothetical protein